MPLSAISLSQIGNIYKKIAYSYPIKWDASHNDTWSNLK